MRGLAFTRYKQVQNVRTFRAAAAIGGKPSLLGSTAAEQTADWVTKGAHAGESSCAGAFGPGATGKPRLRAWLGLRSTTRRTWQRCAPAPSRPRPTRRGALPAWPRPRQGEATGVREETARSRGWAALPSRSAWPRSPARAAMHTRGLRQGCPLRRHAAKRDPCLRRWRPLMRASYRPPFCWDERWLALGPA